jgi:acyl-[acyl-carrier-protein]-phospholipid O-acyltransferase/long-chain-fatty-acid--[acyl-carrier-protein] ligase
MSKIISGAINWNHEQFMKRDSLKLHLGYAAIKALRKSGAKDAFIDHRADRKIVSSRELLSVALILSQKIRKEITEERVGILLPPCLGCVIANLAVVLAGKVPVNLNFTIGAESSQSCMDKANVCVVLSAAAMKSRMSRFPWPEKTLDISSMITGLSKMRMALAYGMISFLPTAVIAKYFGVPKYGENREAAILFTSGSCGLPKGVVLTHQNILGNIHQIDEQGVLPRDEKLLAFLPMFHCFGFTVTLWYPLLRHIQTVYMPSPLEFKRVAEVVEQEKITVLLGTPTFLKPYFKRVDAKQLASLKYVIAGAEKTPEGLHQHWKDHFGSMYLEGYGITETTPVIAVNLPWKKDGVELLRSKSVGRLFPGMAARVIDPETREPLQFGKQGILCFKGVNVFSCYLDDATTTAETFDDEGWYISGDIGYLDADGFIYVDGRLSRFSKIGGEMVPHAYVESKIMEALDLQEEGWVIVVTGRPDDGKGEALVLLSTTKIDETQLREKLRQMDLPNLWIPREVKYVETIPTLASGKLDIKSCQRLAI